MCIRDRLNPTSVNIQTIVLGNILAIDPADILQLTIIGILSIIVLFFKWKDLMAVSYTHLDVYKRQGKTDRAHFAVSHLTRGYYPDGSGRCFSKDV